MELKSGLNNHAADARAGAHGDAIPLPFFRSARPALDAVATPA
jgi:hypothetical protein